MNKLFYLIFITFLKLYYLIYFCIRHATRFIYKSSILFSTIILFPFREKPTFTSTKSINDVYISIRCIVYSKEKSILVLLRLTFFVTYNVTDQTILFQTKCSKKTES